MHSYSTEDDASQIEFARALDSVFGNVDISPPAKTPSQVSALAGSAAAAAIAAGPSTSSGAAEPPFDVSTGGAGTSANLQSGCEGASHSSAAVSHTPIYAADADTVASGAAPVESRCGVPSGAAQDLASDIAGQGPSGSSTTGATTSAGGKVQTGNNTSSESNSATGAAGGRTGGLELEYEVVTQGALDDQSTEDLMVRNLPTGVSC